jgi:preprotein translocase subunit SecD
MRTRYTASLFGIVAVAVIALGAVVLSGTSPKLGLDLQGGTSVVLRPDHSVGSGILNQAISIIRHRVDALGVAEPDISRQGQSIVIELPGVKNSSRALQLVGQTAELRFRPVLATLPPESPAVTPPTTAPGSPPTSLPPSQIPTTKLEDDTADATVVLPEVDRSGSVVRRYQLGPAELTGKALHSASAQFDQGSGTWLVSFTTTGPGTKQFGDLTTKYVGKQLAIELDGVVKSAPTIQSAITGGNGQITGSFTERQAKDLALVLRFGALPVQLKPDTVQTISATLGKDSLRAGIVAGAVGLALVLLYMILYYRALGLVVLLGLGVSGALIYAIVSVLGQSNGLALSLAGATGIIVSVGVTVDSYVVYFERLKDEIRSGKTVRSSVDRGFSRAYRTILAADLVSLIGAGVLYLLTVGSVRGFAFFLGLSTALDLVTAYFFTRPMVVVLGRNRVFTEARWLGVARGLALSGEATA